MLHPQVMLSPFFNYFLKVRIYSHTRQKIVPKLLPQVSVREHHNSLVGEPDDGGLKESIDADNNIIISYSTLRSLLPPQFKNGIKIQCHVWL